MYIFLEFCSQAKIYACISLLILIYMTTKANEPTHYDTFILCIKAAIMISITFGINKLCLLGYKYISWLMAFVPHIITILYLINYSVSNVK